ncbi:nucleotide-binding protein [Corynebacterium lowii]|uniref:nucleotide-binding protein n=1 Tax=Corynebacterium lowii TaxID=1544413 RepID=UPI001FE20178|nr:nucleotide-binding protein [Corynebacterium lowii]MDP9851717.1 putative nucleic acid-binding protein [Corynebacterium lowii]
MEQELLLQRGRDPGLSQIFKADWIDVDRSDDLAFLKLFARYEQRLVGKNPQKNRGECGVLALGKARGWTVVIDDGAPRRIAAEEKIEKTGTLGLLCKAVREERLTVEMVESLTDDLLAGEYYLPFGPGEFWAWAKEQGVI